MFITVESAVQQLKKKWKQKRLSYKIKPEDGRSEGRSTADKQRRFTSAC